MSAKCPKCKSHNFYYVTKATERWYMEDYPDNSGYVDLAGLSKSTNDEDFEPYLECTHCNSKFNLHLAHLHFFGEN
jgi:DNA-directed RNA polymerase subunit M/transcription elongation factor TFIIS